MGAKSLGRKERAVEKRKGENKRGGEGRRIGGTRQESRSEERLLEAPRAALWVALKGEIKASPEH